MKEVNFSFSGGFPLEQDTLDYMQQRDSDIVAAFGLLGQDPSFTTDPYIFSGIIWDVGASAYTEGWIFDNGDLIYFPGGAPPGGDQHIKIINYNTTVVFEDSSTHGVYTNKQYEFDATGTYELNDLKRFQEEFGRWNASENDAMHHNVFSNVNMGPGPSYAKAAGDFYYKKDFIPTMLHIIGEITLTSGNNLGGTPQFDIVTSVLPGWEPAGDVYFTGYVDIATNYIKDVNDKDYIMDVPCLIDNTGKLKVAFIKPIAGQTTYKIRFNTRVPR